MTRLILKSDGSLTCPCGAEQFTALGDDFGITTIECTKCNNRISLIESTLIAEKLLSELGEDYCKVFGHYDHDILIINRLVFTEFQTEVTVSIDDRLNNIRIAKKVAIDEEWFERAFKLREEEKLLMHLTQKRLA